MAENAVSNDLLIKRGYNNKNKIYEQGLFLNAELDLLGPVFHGNKHNFSYLRSNIKDVTPVTPVNEAVASVRFPIIQHSAPYPSKSKVFLQNFYYPEKVHVLNLGQWQMVVDVENCLTSTDKGQTQIFTSIVKSPEHKLCLSMMKVHPFEENFCEATRWEILGELRSLTDEAIQLEGIVTAKLISSGSDMAVIAQYDGQLIALKVLRDFDEGQKARLRSRLTSRTFVVSRQLQDKRSKFTFGKQLTGRKEL